MGDTHRLISITETTKKRKKRNKKNSVDVRNIWTRLAVVGW